MFKDKNGKAIAAGVVDGMSTAASSDYPFQTSIDLPVETLNNAGLTVSADIPALILYSMFSFKGSSQVPVPELKDLIEIPQISLDIDSRWVSVDSSRYLKLLIKATITNDNEFDLATGDLKINVRNSGNGLLGSTSMTANMISGIPRLGTRTLSNHICNSGDVGSIPDTATITVDIEIGLENIKERIPLNAILEYELVPEDWEY